MRENPSACTSARDLRIKFRVPPDVIYIDCDTNAIAKKLANVDGLFESVDAGAVCCIHRMQRLDSKGHVVFPRITENCCDAIGDHFTRSRKVARSLGQSTN